MTLLVLALLAALAAVGAWKYTNGNFYALPEQLHTLLTEHVPPPGGDIGIGPTLSVIAAQCRRGSFFLN